MDSQRRLNRIKLLHTAIWVFFNVVIFYMLYAALTNRLDAWLWTGYALVVTEGIVLVVFRMACPLTILARKYSASGRDNFDIYLPEWLARYTKIIYTTIVVLILIITVYQLMLI
jgi:hypothetical protein